MNTITINDRSIQVPSSWNTLPLDQQISIYSIIMTDVNLLFQPQEVVPIKRIMIFKTLTGFDDAFIEAWQNDCKEAYGEDDWKDVFLSELRELLVIANPFMERIETETEDEPVRYQINLELTKCPYPIIEDIKKLRNRKGRATGRKETVKYFSPADELDNLSFYELGMTFTVFEAYLNDPDNEELLHRLLAILYRPAKPRTNENRREGYRGDMRLPLLHHEATIERRMKKMENLPPLIKKLLVFWFASCRQQIIQSWPNLFKTSEPDVERTGNDYGWGGVLMSLSGGLANIEAVGAQNYANALTYLSMKEDEAKELERQRKMNA